MRCVLVKDKLIKNISTIPNHLIKAQTILIIETRSIIDGCWPNYTTITELRIAVFEILGLGVCI